MNAQEIFDIAAQGVIKQGTPSFKNGRCRYRGDDGCKCGVGHLLPDDVAAAADEGCDGTGIGARHLFSMLPPKLVQKVEELRPYETLLAHLQFAHDEAAKSLPEDFIATFKEQMRALADHRALNPNILDEVLP